MRLVINLIAVAIFMRMRLVSRRLREVNQLAWRTTHAWPRTFKQRCRPSADLTCGRPPTIYTRPLHSAKMTLTLTFDLRAFELKKNWHPSYSWPVA